MDVMGGVRKGMELIAPFVRKLFSPPGIGHVILPTEVEPPSLGSGLKTTFLPAHGKGPQGLGPMGMVLDIFLSDIGKVVGMPIHALKYLLFVPAMQKGENLLFPQGFKPCGQKLILGPSRFVVTSPGRGGFQDHEGGARVPFFEVFQDHSSSHGVTVEDPLLDGVTIKQ